MYSQPTFNRWNTEEGRHVTAAILHALRTDDWSDHIYAFTGTPRESHAFRLKGIDLSGQDLDELDLSQLMLNQASFIGSSLVRTDLQGCDLDGSDFTGADLRSAQLAGCTARGASFKDASLAGCFAMSADFTAADFSGANLTRAAMSGTVAIRADFEQTIFDHTDLEASNWKGARLNPARWNGMASASAPVSRPSSSIRGKAFPLLSAPLISANRDRDHFGVENESYLSDTHVFLLESFFSHVPEATFLKAFSRPDPRRVRDVHIKYGKQISELHAAQSRVAAAIVDIGRMEKYGVLKVSLRFLESFGRRSGIAEEVSSHVLRQMHALRFEDEEASSGAFERRK